ncbi:CS1 type fimbrial major subunit [Pseudomonas atagonensis]|uniref:CS1 type fimbrial major subunit n=1 Tax=Pseudomonas atagonensis TaxID=2609964 RepID=UPI00140A6133|nr:CS1 type fimbrial major subunit [Pseudomonas atagonensis]
MFKQLVLATPLAILALSSSVAFAAEEEKTTINITADIPSKVFHARPVDPQFGKAEQMIYQLGLGTLTPVTGTYDVQHTNGAVGAYVEGGPQPLYNGSNTIALTYTFNGKVLTGASQEVVGDSESNGGMRTDLVIRAAKPTDGQYGLYTANPVVMFDALPRIP